MSDYLTCQECGRAEVTILPRKNLDGYHVVGCGYCGSEYVDVSEDAPAVVNYATDNRGNAE